MKLSRVAQWTFGELIGRDAECLGVCTDTRSLETGNLFVALRGEHFDAHEFLQQAAECGAAGALSERDTDAFPGYVRVPDTRRALGLLAAGWAARFALPTVAITGSAGKTTVKEMLAVMLGDRVLATEGNLNNAVGVPLTLLRAGPEHRYAVVELGASAPGEIAWTTTLVQPRVAMVTNVSGAHLHGFGSMEGIAEAKAEIFQGVRPGGIAVINMDDDQAGRFVEEARKRKLDVLRIGFGADMDLGAVDIDSGDNRVDFLLVTDQGRWPVHLPLPGRHQVSNALMALGAMQALGLPLEPAVRALARLEPVPGRMHGFPCGGGTLVDDSYNASPGSLRAAIETLAEMPRPRALVLGAMAELGEASQRLHETAGRQARQAGIDHVFAVGPEAGVAARAFGDGGEELLGHDQAEARARPLLAAGGTVLVKGSRSTGMDRVVAALRDGGGSH